jgi:hypothetical protein
MQPAPLAPELTLQRRRPFEPAPRRGLGRGQFRLACVNGFGDGHNSFAHSMAWFNGRLYVGTTRSNFQMLKVQHAFRNLPVYCWPVEGPDDTPGLYRLDRHAQIWEYDPAADRWQQAFRAPLVDALDQGKVARETGYRTMTVFQGEADPAPALYVATWAVSRSPGSMILRSYDGRNFEPVTDYGIIPGENITATRVLVPFKGRLFTSPNGTRGYDVKFAINVSAVPIIFETRDPLRRGWTPVCAPSFGEPQNQGIFALCVFNDQLYAGTFNNEGFQVWRSDCEGNPPYRWTKVVERGAWRGPNNQAVASMVAFRDALYVGSGIQNGGHDRVNNIGPAGSELIRIHPDDTWDLIVGEPRDTPFGRKEPLSGLPAGFGNVLNGYFWAMGTHDGWIYVGTMDSTIWLEWLREDAYSERVKRLVDGVGAELILEREGGCDLWRSADGENWLPVTRNGFANKYNLGIRNIVSTPFGLFLAAANPFGPRVAKRLEGMWQYVDNDRGGLEVWHGR